MTKQEFIFSNKSNHRLARHLVMWLCMSAYIILVNFYPTNAAEIFSSKVQIRAVQRLIYLPVSLVSVYISVYILLPYYLMQKKYFAYAIWMILLLSLNVTHAWLLTKLLAALTQPVHFNQLPVQFRIFQPITNGLGISFATSGVATIIKIFKIDYLKQKENEKLLRQKTNTELHRIKANFHPAFLSDSLKKISFLLRTRSPESPAVILSLSDLLSYSLYDNEKEYVPLAQEIQMIKEYTSLETKMMTGKLVVSVEDNTTKADDLKIPPLLLLSVVQNICEYLQRKQHESLELSIKTSYEHNMLIFQLNFKGIFYTNENNKNLSGLLKNSLHRIQLLYPGKYRLDSYLEKNLFSLLLLIETSEHSPGMNQLNKPQPAYASA